MAVSLEAAGKQERSAAIEDDQRPFKDDLERGQSFVLNEGGRNHFRVKDEQPGEQ